MKFLYGTSIQDIYTKNRTAFMQLVADEPKPVTHSKLVKRFIAGDGKQYYGFPKDAALPIERYGQLMDYMRYITKGLTPQEDEQIDNAIASVALHEKDSDKKSIRIAGLLAERERRRKMCFPTEIFYNYIAVQLVREDEPVESFDNDIQMQKVIQFKEDSKKKESTWHYFQIPEFKKLNDLLLMSQDEWIQSWQQSEDQGKLLSQILQVYTSATISEKEKKISKVSS